MLTLLKSPTTMQMKTALQLATIRTINLGDRHQAPTSPKHYDIIIAGGGLVGTTLALALSQNAALADKRVLLLEGAPPFKGFDVTKQYGNRVSAINRRSIELFQSVGAWDRIKAARIKPVKQMQVWDASSDALIKFQHEHFADDVACIVENDLILDTMYSLLGSAEKVQIRNQARIESVALSANTGKARSEVGLQGGDTFTCDLVIGADGANSLVRKQLGVDVFSINYDAVGVVATLEVSDAGDNSVAWQRFIPTGPLAMLPLNESMSSLVWSTNAAHAKQLLTMPETDFVDALNEAFCKQYPKNTLALNAVNALNSLLGYSSGQTQYPPRVRSIIEQSRASFPLGFLHASSYVCSGAALVGDAAHRIHPLAGQGVNLGFSDVRYLVDALADAVYSGAKLGDKMYLIKYEQKSLTNNVPILVGVHSLQTLYSTTFSPVVLLRSLGLQIAESIPPIKKLFMKRAMG